MRAFASRLLLAVGVLLLSFGSGMAGDEQMLPPTNFGGAGACTLSSNQVLIFGGNGSSPQSAIVCDPHFTADSGGNVTMGGTLSSGAASVSTLSIGGSGALNSTSANTLLNLQGMNCSADEYLTNNGAGTFQCEDIVNLAGIGPTIFPNCGTSQGITWNGSSFGCLAAPSPLTTTCPAGQVVQSINSGTATCVEPISDQTCGSGNFMTGITGGTIQCGTPPSPPPAPAPAGGTCFAPPPPSGGTCGGGGGGGD